GDLGRLLPDHNIEFFGRIDHQVKVRGVRIEVEEIENHLCTHPNIKEAAVTVISRGSDAENYLCAYYAAHGKVKATALKEYLATQVADYMIPSYFIQMETIPLIAGGKINRKALPAPETNLRNKKTYCPPTTVIEIELMEIWKSVLEMKEELIGIDTDFFEIGGHSLKAINVISKINKKFQVEFPLTVFFEKSTVRQQALVIKNAETNVFQALERVEKRYYYPVSAAQKRMYALNRFAPESISYNMTTALHMEGELSTARIEEVFQTLVQRHESLRTSFLLIDGKPVQRIHDRVEFAVTITGGSDKNHGNADAALERFLRPFELSLAPLMRVELVKQDENNNLFMFDIHHIISDGVSIGLIVKEFGDMYAGLELKPLTVQYKDYAAWQNSFLQTPGMEKQKSYWLEKFSGEIPVLTLPTDYTRPPVQRFDGGEITFEIDEEVTAQLYRLTGQYGATLYMTLLALFNILLSKYSGQGDIVVGSPSAGRSHADLENIIGMFVNTLAMRNAPEPGKSFAAFLSEVKQSSLEAFENQGYQFDDLLEHLDLKRDLSRNPLFDTMFILQNAEDSDLEIKGLTLRPCEFKNKISKFDLNLNLYEGEGKLLARLEYCVKLFKQETMERFSSHYVNILKEAIATPTITLAEINMLSEAEEMQLLYEFNNTRADYPGEKTIHQLFEEQVERTPDSISAVGKETIEDKERTIREKTSGIRHQASSTQSTQSTSSTPSFPSTQSIHLTYHELNKKSNQLATLLQAKGVEPNTIVGIMAGRSIEMVIGIMAILKAGGAYLPIDPDYPEARKQFMLKDSSAALLLNASSTALEKDVHEKIINIREVSGNSNASNVTAARNQAPTGPKATNFAYVIYTSGSTGLPKGVAVPHTALANFLYSMYTLYDNDFGKEDSCLSITPLAFDVSVCELFLPLIFGSRIVLWKENKINDIGELATFLIKEKITFSYIPPAILKEVCKTLETRNAVDSAASSTAIRFNKMLVGVEPILDFVLESYIKLNRDMRIVNGYGPTETTICATAYRYRSHRSTAQRVPIGKPLRNTKIIISDTAGNLLPVGVSGELSIFGAGLAHGYLNRPELTAEKFKKSEMLVFPNSQYPITNNYLYHTGDRAKWLPDGNIEFVGRIDNQVKVRGYRIELGEIENRLLANKNIKAAVVTTNKENENNHYITAYYVEEDSDTGKDKQTKTLDISQLREILSETLPDYMIPSYFVPLEKIPLTPNGKIDRKALPEPGANARTSSEYQAPGNETEEKLVDMWQEVLGLKRIGITDNFFEIGGHSLKAINLISKIKRIFRVELTLTTLFESPYIKEQARTIRQSGTTAFTAVEAVEKMDYYPVSAAQKRLYALNRLTPGEVNYNMPGALRIEGDLSITRFEGVFQTLIRRHESLRTSFHFIEGEPVQQVHEAESVEFAVKHSGETGHSGFLRPFDLTRAPLLRVELVTQEENSHIFRFDMHHIISDGVSMELLVKEFSAIYARQELESLTLQYKDYAAWQNRFMESEGMQKQKEYWQEKFSTSIPVLSMPTDYPRPAIQNFEGETIPFEIDEEITAQLYRVAGEHGATLYMVLLALFNVLLARYSGQEDIIVGSPSAGRRDTDLENIIGMFVNTLAKRNAPAAAKPFQDFLKEVKQNSLEAFENQDYQFDDLLEHLDIQRDLGRNPLFDTMFILQNLEESQLEIEGLTFEPYELENNVSKFDLTLQVNEEESKLSGHLEYCVKLFKRETIKRLTGHFMNLLKETVKAPALTIGQINILSEAEEKQLLHEFNDTAVEYPKDKTIHQLFEEQVARTPDLISIVGSIRHPASSIQSTPSTLSTPSTTSTQSTQLTYREFDKKSNQLAAQLRKKGVKPDIIVAIMAQRSVQMMIGIMAILKAGGAYLPIDPQYPEVRKQFILKDSLASILLTTTPEAGETAGHSNVINIDEALGSDSSYQAPGSRSLSSTLAYVIYTSGST
ncbi:MAG: amino acid adenylation domain-containing protein, partial [bacterium]|nr:amino acid adenylation domain-containing protein [bacterium]